MRFHPMRVVAGGAVRLLDDLDVVDTIQRQQIEVLVRVESEERSQSRRQVRTDGGRGRCRVGRRGWDGDTRRGPPAVPAEPKFSLVAESAERAALGVLFDGRRARRTRAGVGRLHSRAPPRVPVRSSRPPNLRRRRTVNLRQAKYLPIGAPPGRRAALGTRSPRERLYLRQALARRARPKGL